MFYRRNSLGEAAPAPADTQFYYEAAIYVYDKILAASTEYRNQVRTIDGDADFVLLAISGSATAIYQLVLLFPTGRPLSNDYVKATNLVGTAQFPTAFPAEIVYPAGNGIGLHIKDTSGAENTVQLLFHGLKRFRR